MLLQFPFLVREKGALIDRQSLRFACRARSVGGAFSQTKLCTWMTATCAVASHSSQRAVLQTAMCRIRQNGKAKPAYVVFQYHTGRWYDGDFSSFH